MRLLPYPGGKRFAFTVVDDTDGATLENVRPVYEWLRELGFRTTKTVWVRPPWEDSVASASRGDTLQRGEYREFVERLQAGGFEIALHNATGASNTREQTVEGLELFRAALGRYPRMNVQHEKNRENLYFDFAQDAGRLHRECATRLGRAVRQASRRVLGRHQENGRPHRCCGEVAGTPYFWGDVCQQLVRYVRTNVFLRELNTVRVSSGMPFHWDGAPWVNYWFDCSNGGDRERFLALVSERQVTELTGEHGCALVYTHFGRGFCENRGAEFALDAEVRRRLAAIASHSDGWFAPASEVLDRLLVFQRVRWSGFSGGILMVNDNACDVRSVTIAGAPHGEYWLPDGRVLETDGRGVLVVPCLDAGSQTVVVARDVMRNAATWNAEEAPGWRTDMEMVMRRARVWRQGFGHQG